MLTCPEETQYRWLDAAKFYEATLQSGTLVSGFSVADYWRKIGLCYDYASRQASSADDFRSLRRKSVEAFEKASGLFGENSEKGQSLECLARAEFTRSWLASDSAEGTQAIDKCRELAGKAIKLLKTKEASLVYGQTVILLSRCLIDRSYLTSNGKEKSEIAKESMKTAEEAISVLSKLDAKDELVVAFAQASIQAWYNGLHAGNEEDRKKASSDSISYANQALKLSNEVSSAFSKAVSHWGAALSNLSFTGDTETALKCATEMLEQATTARDNYLRGAASYMIADAIGRKAVGEANPERRRRFYEEIIRRSEEGVRFLGLVFQDELMAEACQFAVQTYLSLASDFAVHLSEKLVYAKRAMDIAKKGLEYAGRSGSSEAIMPAFDGLSNAYHHLASLEPKSELKPALLNDALCFRKEQINNIKESFPSDSWVFGAAVMHSGQMEAELSDLEKDDQSKLAMLKDAISDMEQGVSLAKGWFGFSSMPFFGKTVAGYEDALGGVLEKNFLLTMEKGGLTRANEVYLDAASGFDKADLTVRVAECYWKMARNLDRLSAYDQSASNFEHAFTAYKAAAQKTAQFGEFYLDYASYMKAWSEIELAKLAHFEQKFDVAAQHFEKASQLLRQSKSWTYLSQNFSAWSHLSQAEDLSRKDRTEESIENFEKSVKSLQESKRNLNNKLESADKTDERDLVNRLIQVSEIREEFCRGRIAVEEAKALHKKGDHLGSSDKYEKAAEIFQRITLTDSIQSAREAKPLNYLCQAWQKITAAEARASPIMCEEAADLFKLANEYSFEESARFMSRGHNSFCKASECGMEFEITQTMAMYVEASRHLDAAAEFYLKAGFEAISDYAKGIRRLFDAYVFMESAKRERDSEKQGNHFSKAEKALGEAAAFFEKAKHTNMAEKAQKLLQRVREEKKLGLSLGDIFHAPDITASTASFSTIAARDEFAVGLARFEHGDVQAKLIQTEAEIKIGNPTTLEVYVINVGKEPVSLTALEDIIPSGFQLVEKPDYCQFEGTQLSMRGKRLDPLVAEGIKVVLRSFMMGSVEIEPRVVCVDFVGRELVHGLEPAVFNVVGVGLPGRVSTGFSELDSLLFGGIPEKYSVVLAAPSSDERELLVKRFLETGIKKDEITFYITAETAYLADLVDESRTNFYLFVCNPRADVMVKDLPQVFKMKGLESLTDIDIALVKSFRMLNNSKAGGPKRVCIDVISDVLLQHHAVTTRRWLSSLLPDLKSKGFTTLAVVNPQMHPPEEVQAILGLFEGEIRISEKETTEGLKEVLRIRKLYNQRYLENEIVLTREKLEF